MKRNWFRMATMLLLAGLLPAAAQTYNQTPGTVVGWGSQLIPYMPPGTALKATAIGAGGGTSYAIRPDGTVEAWGSNSLLPEGLSNVTAITCCTALKSDGTVVAWWRGSQNPVLENLSDVIAISAGPEHSLALKSDGTVVTWGNGCEPIVPEGLNGVIAIAAGLSYSLALKSDGTVVAWGSNYGEVTVLNGFNNATAIAAGWHHSLALKSDGTVVAWGDNQCQYGQSTVPGNLTGVIAIAAGAYHSLALKSDGTVVAWGAGGPGLTGTDHQGQSTVPEGLSGVVAIAAGEWHSLALKSDGTVVSWGQNCQMVPGSLRSVIAIAAGGDHSRDHSLALKSGGTVVAWGDNAYGQSTVPPGLTGVVAIAAGEWHSLALKNDGTVAAWGNNHYGQSTVPEGLSGVVAIAAGYCHNLALKNDGTVVAWGYNYFGQSTVPEGLNGVIAIAAGYSYSLALKQDGTVVKWGGGTTVPLGLNNVTAIASGAYNSLALKSDGTVVAWGNNQYGQSTVPSGLNNVIAVAAGWASLALKNDGTVVAWGYNYYGESTVPEDLSGVIAIAVAKPRHPRSPHCLALVRDSTAPTETALHGRVTDANGVPLPGATVAATVGLTPAAQATTDASGNYTMPALAPGAYLLWAWDATHQTSIRALTLGASTARQDFQLSLKPGAPVVEPVDRQPDLSHNTGPEHSELRVFDSSQREFVRIVSGQNVPPEDRMTIVLTHGWNSDPTVWARGMARTLRDNGVTPGMANIVAWNWELAARGLTPPVRKVTSQGEALGKELSEVFGAGYAQPVHFVGHSLGALVNAAAANYLHGYPTGQQPVLSPPWSWQRTHVTVFDHAEAANFGGLQALFNGLNPSALIGLNVPYLNAITTQNWMPPLPQDFAWADNYVSLVGFFESRAVNVRLQQAAWETSPTLKHRYSIDWYGWTIADPTDALLGFQRSREYGLVAGLPASAFPPSGLSGNYYQSLMATDPLVLYSLPTVNQTVGFVADKVVQAAAGVVQVAGNVTATIQDTAQTAAQAVASGFNYVVDVASQGGQTLVSLYDSAVLRLTLFTAPGASPAPRPQDAGVVTAQGDPVSPPMAWLPIEFPANAVAMAFDFTVEGQPADDALVCGIGTNNLFSLEARYIPTNTMSASPLLDVSAWAGATNELFFGFLGGTSTNAALVIENIRFYSLEPPRLEIAREGNTVLLTWPATAGGYAVESTPTLTPPAWEFATNAPAILAERYVLTNAWSDQSRFFRLRPR